MVFILFTISSFVQAMVFILFTIAYPVAICIWPTLGIWSRLTIRANERKKISTVICTVGAISQ